MRNEMGRGWMMKVLECRTKDDELYSKAKGSH